MPVRDIPKILALTDWTAKQGVIAGMACETGIGAALTKLKTAWAKIPWDELDPDVAVNQGLPPERARPQRRPRPQPR
jgi:hypothetical protein